MNGYQMKKAKRIARFLIACGAATCTRTTNHQLARVVAIMSTDEWRTVSFQAGEPLADIQCKAAVLAMLRGRTIHGV